jgi:hypothetical protein
MFVCRFAFMCSAVSLVFHSNSACAAEKIVTLVQPDKWSWYTSRIESPDGVFEVSRVSYALTDAEASNSAYVATLHDAAGEAKWTTRLITSRAKLDVRVSQIEEQNCWVVEFAFPRTYRPGEEFTFSVAGRRGLDDRTVDLDADFLARRMGANHLVSFAINNQGAIVARQFDSAGPRIRTSDGTAFEGNPWIGASLGYVDCTLVSATNEKLPFVLFESFPDSIAFLPSGRVVLAGPMSGAFVINGKEYASANLGRFGFSGAYVAHLNGRAEVEKAIGIGPLVTDLDDPSPQIAVSDDGTTLIVGPPSRMGRKINTPTGSVSVPRNQLPVFEIDPQGRVTLIGVLGTGHVYPKSIVPIRDRQYLVSAEVDASKGPCSVELKSGTTKQLLSGSYWFVVDSGTR